MSKSVVRLWSSPWRCVTQQAPKSTTVEYRSSEKTCTDGSRAVQPFQEIPGIVLSRNDALVKALFGLFSSRKKNSMSMHFNTIKKYGEIVKISTKGISERDAFVLVANPGDIATVFRNIGPNPYRPGMEVLKESLEAERKHTSGLVWSQGEEWKSLRSRVSKQILVQKVLKYAPLITAVATDFVEHLKSTRGVDGYVDDIYQPLVSWAFEGIAVFLLNERLGVFHSPTQDLVELQKKASDFIKGTSYMGKSLGLHKFIPTPGQMKFLKAVEYLDSWSKQCISTAKDRMATSGFNSDITFGFLDQWLSEGKLTNAEIVALLRDFFAGGIDTTSTTATVTLHELAKNPKVQDRLYKEVLSVLGPHGQPDEKSYQKLSYTKSIIKEIFRYRPISAGIPTTLFRDVVLSGYHVPAGVSSVVSPAGHKFPVSIPCENNCYMNVHLWSYNINTSSHFYFHFEMDILTWRDTYKTKILPIPGALARDPRYFKDPDCFMPERWMGDRKHHPFLLNPFGFGPRACYGRRLSELELTMLLVQISQSFILHTDHNDFDYHCDLIMEPLEGVRIQFKDR